MLAAQAAQQSQAQTAQAKSPERTEAIAKLKRIRQKLLEARAALQG